MADLLVAMNVSTAVDFALVIILYWLWTVHGNKSLLIWSAGWLFHGIGNGLQLGMAAMVPAAEAFLSDPVGAYLGLSPYLIAYALWFWGVERLVYVRPVLSNLKYLFLALAFIWPAVGYAVGDFVVYTITISLLSAISLGFTAWLFWEFRKYRKSMGKAGTGLLVAGLVLFAIHSADYPFLANTELVGLGFFLGAALKGLIAAGFVATAGDLGFPKENRGSNGEDGK